MCLTSRLNGDSKFSPSLWVAQVLLETICSELIFGNGNCERDVMFDVLAINTA